MPASPGFYNRPANIQELVDGMVARILDQLDLEHNWGRRWDPEPENEIAIRTK
jgi:4-hydroxy-3-polyprenylbenzoate decarboxylase